MTPWYAVAVLALALSAAPKGAKDDGGSITLYMNEQRVITVKCNLQRIAVDATPVGALQRIAVGDASIADIKTIGNNQVLIIGAGVGKTTLLMWCSNGQRVSWLVEVLPGERPPRESPVPVTQTRAEATVIDGSGARSTSVTIVELPGDLRDVSEVVQPDGGVSFVGLDSAGLKVTITPTPYRPRPRAKADAGVRIDGGSRRDGG